MYKLFFKFLPQPYEVDIIIIPHFSDRETEKQREQLIYQWSHSY